MKHEIFETLQYNPVDIQIAGTCKIDNPFYAKLEGEFHGPEGQKIIIPGFYDGGEVPIWKVRFSPTATGTWTFIIRSSDIEVDISEGRVQCSENMNANIHGGLVIDSEYPHHFVHEDGTRRFTMGYECNWLWALEMDSAREGNVEELIHIIKEYGFNEIVMNIYAHRCNWTDDKRQDPYNYGCPEQYLWEGTNEQPDHSRMNLAFFESYDRVMNLLLQEGINVHLYFKVYNKAVNWPLKYSKEEELFFKYVTARYQAFCNVTWDFSKETYNEPDKEYVRDMICLIKQNDGYKRLITVHDDPLFYSQDKYAKLLDFQTLQQLDDFYISVLRQREKRAWPVLNAEFSYEHGPGGINDVTWAGSNTPGEVIYRAYQTVMAGGYPTYYYTYTAWDVIDYRHKPHGYELMKIMYEFFTSIEWWKLTPNEEVCCWRMTRCLEEIGQQYVFFFYNKIMLNLDLEVTKFSGYYMNTHTGEKVEANLLDIAQTDKSDSIIKFFSPFNEVPTILYIKRNDI